MPLVVGSGGLENFCLDGSFFLVTAGHARSLEIPLALISMCPPSQDKISSDEVCRAWQL